MLKLGTPFASPNTVVDPIDGIGYGPIVVVGGLGIAVSAMIWYVLARQSMTTVKSFFTPSRFAVTKLGWKVFWVSMLFMHVLPILAAISCLLEGLANASWASGDLVRLLGLIGSAAFFFLKIIDVPWLRAIPTWRARVAAFVIVALLHAGAIERSGVADARIASAQLGLVVLVAVSVNAESVRALLARFGRIRSLACNNQSITDMLACISMAYELPFLPYESSFSYRPTLPRAPPLG